MSTTTKVLVFLHVLLSINLFPVSGESQLVLHTRDEEEPITLTQDHCGAGVYFKEDRDFSCACLTGLWAFFEDSCEQARLIVGGSDGQCIPINFKIRQVIRLSPPDGSLAMSSAAVLDRDLTSIGDRFTSVESDYQATRFVLPGFPVVITTGRQSWRLPEHNKCMKPLSESNTTTYFCLFNHYVDEEYSMEDVECFEDDEILEPIKCFPYMSDGVYEQKTIPRSCDNIPKRRVRRSRKRAKGRMFLGAVEELKDDVTPSPENITNVDENHNLTLAVDQPVLNSELWNFMTTRAQNRLGIRDQLGGTPPSDKSYSPSFSFLNLAKKVQQKNCPDHYVGDEHYEVAVGAFLAIQRNHLKFADTFVDFATSERIEESLNACLANISQPYPFIERTGYENVECNGTKPTPHGSYFKFNEILELSIRSDLASRANEPIIETVWKVFVHTHSACYPFFKDNYNDHHRFTTVMLNLFTNDIHDMWFNITELRSDIYTGFLGNAVDLMDSVAYCSLFSRLESSYPWDLPRPKKFNASRRKRQILIEEETSSGNTDDYQCVEESDARNFCRLETVSPERFKEQTDDQRPTNYL